MLNRANRAAQFLPFDSLKGLQEELRNREYQHSKVVKRELNEDEQNKISEELQRIQKGSCVKIKFYFDGHYKIIEGAVTALNLAYKFIVVEETKILFSDINAIKLIS